MQRKRRGRTGSSVLDYCSPYLYFAILPFVYHVHVLSVSHYVFLPYQSHWGWGIVNGQVLRSLGKLDGMGLWIEGMVENLEGMVILQAVHLHPEEEEKRVLLNQRQALLQSQTLQAYLVLPLQCTLAMFVA